MAIDTQIQREAPDIEARKLGLIDTAKALTEKGYTLPDYLLAQLTPEQQQAFGLAQSGIGGYQPYLDAARQATTQGQNLVGGITGAPTTAQLESYMNPFQQQVIDATMTELDKRGAQQSNQLAGDAVRGNVFGGSRYGIQQAELAGQQQDARAQALATLNAQNYGQAMQGYQGEMERQRMAGMGIGALGAQQAQLGAQAQGLAGQDIQSLLASGGMQQQYAQQQLDMNRQNQVQGIMQPYQQLAFYGDVMQGAPSSSQVFNTAQGYGGPSAMQAGIGTGIGALTGLAGLKKLGVV
tara:strand:- start:490 stop:1374 length:885 start_codon:yes stop_codon:yes gene_type:complete